VRRFVPLACLLAVLGVAAPARADGPLFAGGKGWFTRPIAGGTKVDRNSGYWLGQLAAQHPRAYLNGPSGQFAPPVYVAGPATPIRTVRCPYCGSFPGGGPTGWTDVLHIPIPDDAIPDPSTDGHMAVIDATRGIEWDLITARPDPAHPGDWTATGAGAFALDDDGHQSNDAGGGSATGSRLPLSPALSSAEVAQAIADGSYLVPHAIEFTAPNVDRRCWTYPALGSDGADPKGMPEGARIRLSPSFDVSALPPGPRVIARTLQVYGAYLRDVGGAFAFYLRPDRSGGTPWSALGIDGDALDALAPTDFQVLRVSYDVKGLPQPIATRASSACGRKNYAALAPAGAADRTPPTAPRRVSTRTTKPGVVKVCWKPASDDVGVIGYEVIVDGVVRAKPTGRCAPVHVRHAGRHTIEVAAVDAAGNVGPTARRTVRVKRA
jgi:hypothetical protein